MPELPFKAFDFHGLKASAGRSPMAGSTTLIRNAFEGATIFRPFFCPCARLPAARLQAAQRRQVAAQLCHCRTWLSLRDGGRRENTLWEHSIPPVDQLRYSITFPELQSIPSFSVSQTVSLLRRA
jgi:hypothetical protein